MSERDAFFDEKKAAAVLKHGILARYTPVFAMKTGSTSTGNRVVILDGYAGPGRYGESGDPGSPIVLAEAVRSLRGKRDVELIFIEEKKVHYERLQGILKDELGDVAAAAHRGTVEKYLPEVLKQSEGVPFFAFLDPYGLAPSFDDITTKIFGRPHFLYAPATEVLLNFSSEGTRRVGGYLTSTKNIPGKAATLEHMDAVCGGDWWRQVYLDAKSPGDAAEAIAEEYLGLVCAKTRSAGWTVEVRNAQHHQPKYNLVYLTRHRDGFLHFAEAVSSAQADWRRATVVPGTFLDDPGAFKANEDALAAGWSERIEKNLRALLVTTPRIGVLEHYSEIFEGLYGEARMMHLRTALKRLHKEGVLSSTGAGSPLWDYPIIRA